MGKFNLYDCDTPEEVHILVSLGHNINGNGQFNSPLYCACGRGNFEVLKTLYELGAKHNRSSSSLLTTAICSKNSNNKVIRFLIENNIAKPKQKHIFFALRENNVEIAQYFISQIDPDMVIDFNKPYKSYYENDCYIIRDLCQNQNYTNTKCTDALEYILKNGADPNIDISGVDDACCYLRGATPLVCAAIYGFVDGVKLLIKYGATIHRNTINAIIAGCYHDYSDGDMHKTSANDIEESIKIIMNNSELGINQPNPKYHNKTPLMSAFNGPSDYVKMLIKLGANVLARDDKGRTVLMHALKGSETHDSLHLLINQESINIQDNKGKTALAHACIHIDEKIVNILLEKGGDPTIQDNMQNTPIMQPRFIKLMEYASYTDEINNILNAFVRAGCNINTKNKKGSTLLRLVMNNPKIKSVYINMLKKLGATYY